MYEPYTQTGNLLLVHQTMVKEELERNDPHLHRYFRSTRNPEAVGAIRRLAGKVFIALGTRLDPAARPVQATADLPLASRTAG